MVLRQVGERADRKADAVYAVEHERVRGNLHDNVRAACVAHTREQRVQLVGFRRGALGFDDLAADEVLVGADEADLVTRVLEHMLDEVGRGGLAVRAGDAEHHHAVRRMAEAVRRNLRERDARIFDNDCGNALGRLLADHRRRALLERLRDILMSVGRVAADGDEKVALLHRTRVVSDFVYLRRAVCRVRQNGNVLQKLLQFHKTSSYRSLTVVVSENSTVMTEPMLTLVPAAGDWLLAVVSPVIWLVATPRCLR